MKKQVIIYLFLLHSIFTYGQFTKISIADTPNRGNRGAALDPIGDVNNDGIKDFVAGAWLEDITSFKNAGKAYVISGSDQSIIRELVSPAPQIEGWFGYSVASGYDLNGDAVQDIVVGAPGENGGAAGSGKVHVFNGANGALLYSLSSPSAVINGNFGNAVLIQMDLDGSGSKEIIVGAYQEHGSGITASGKVHVFNANLFRNTIISGNSEEYGGFGWRLATANNFIGTTSLIVSAIFENPGASPINSGVLYAFNMANPNSPLLKMMQEQNPTIFGCFGWSLNYYNDATNGGAKLVVMDEFGKITTINNDGTQGLVNTLYGSATNSITTGNFNKNLIPDFATATNVIYDILDTRTQTNILSGSRLFIYERGFGDAIMNLGDNNNDTEDEIVAYSASSIGETFIYQINSAPVIPPTITSFTPSSGGAYTSVIITGTNFGLNGNTVKFNGKETYSYAINATSLQTSVPVGSTTGSISVTFGGEKATSTLDFIVPTIISSFSPIRSSIGSSVVITGANFNSTPANNVVRFGAAKALVTSASATSLTVTVPLGATYAPISILNNGLMAYSAERFVPVFAGSSTIDATSLATKVDFPTGANPNTIVTGDLDDDGKIDIVTANQSANSISIFRNTSSSGAFTSGTFATKVDLSTGAGSAPVGITLKDFDGDGKLDIAIANSGANSVSVFRNISTSGSLTVSSFAARVQFVTGTNPYWCDGADIDADGRTDLITANSGSNSISVLRNLSTPGSITTGSFAVNSDWTTGTQPYHLSIGDLDGDGRPEVATANFTGQSLSLLKNQSSTGFISFMTKVDFSATYPVRVAMGDVDNDGLTDLVLSNYGATGTGAQISVYKNQTPQQNSELGTQVGSLFSGSLAVPNTYTTPIGPYGVGLSDLNGDGYIDIAIASYQSNKLSIFKNQGDGSFASKVDFNTGTQPYDVTIGDFDGDTRVDIAVPNYGSTSMSLFRNAIAFLAPTITNFTPQNAAAGTSVVITGTNLTSASVVNFGGTAAASFVINSATSITALVAAGTSGNVSVTTPGGSASLPGFTFLPAPTISTFNPTTAGESAVVTIGGNNFTGATDVSFGGTPAASFNVVSATSITAVLAAGASGTVSVTTPGGNATLAGFTFIPIPTISSFNPTSAGNVGTVTITGTNFTGATAVSFGGTAATSFSVVSATSITAVVASGTSGSVSVTTPGGTGTLAGFIFVPAPTISSFNPTSAASGSTVTITGTDFTGATAVSFGGTAATSFNVASATSITAVVATGTSGSVSVTTPGGTVTLAGFIFVPAPTISSFNPTSAASGSTVTITGTNLTGATVVSFGGTAAASFNVVSATSITAVVAAGTSGSVSLTTPGGTSTLAGFTFVSTAVAIANESFLTTYDKGSTLTVSVTVNDVNLVSAVNFKSRGITEATTALKSVSVTPVGNKYEKIVAASDLTDPIGLLYSFEVFNKATPAVAVNSTTGKAYVKFPSSSTDQVLPGLSFGNQVNNYQIIAVPLELTNKSVTSVFAPLMPYDKTKWRLFDYASNDNREYSAFSTIDAGKGYWLIVKTSTTINPGEGKTVQADDTSPFTINLNTGWNLIGNPYNFRVSWPDVLAANSNPAGVGTSLKIFSGGALTDGTVLEKYRGAFVFSNNAVALKIPVLKTLTGRTEGVKDIENSLDQNHWEVKLNLQQGILRNELGGIGMNPKATLLGKDTFDEVSVPLPDGLGLFELAYPHPEVFADFNKEVVPTQENFTWEFDVNRDDPNISLALNWSNHYFGENEKQLVLFDPATLQAVDMRLENHFTLTDRTKKLKILFGGKDYVQRALDKELPWLGNAYPNPAKEELTIPFRVPESHDQMMVQIKVYNSQGAEVATPINRILANGSYNVKWLPQGESGLYIIRMKIGQQETKAMKVIIN